MGAEVTNLTGLNHLPDWALDALVKYELDLMDGSAPEFAHVPDNAWEQHAATKIPMRPATPRHIDARTFSYLQWDYAALDSWDHNK